MTPRLARALGVAALIVVAPLAAFAQVPAPGTNLQVFLMTFGPGEQVWERFGHNAIWIRDTVARTDAIYGYGTFDFAAPGFVWRFAMGRPRYWMAVDSSIDGTVAMYRQLRRSLNVQELNLTAAQRFQLSQRLIDNVRPENKTYTYNYFADNCSTRVRDMLDGVLDGALRRATQRAPAEGTLRFHTLRSIASDKLLYLGIDAGLGPKVDEPLDQWREMFLPAKVEQRLRELRVPGPDGRDVPLVKREGRLIDLNVFRVEPAPPEWGGGFLAIGFVLAFFIGTGSAPGRRGALGRMLAWLLLAVAGLSGLVLLFLWLVTDHVATAGNRNVLLLNPIALLLLPAFWSRGSPAAVRWYARVSCVMLAALALAVLLALVPAIGGQRNLDIAELTALPMATAIWTGWRAATRRKLVPDAQADRGAAEGFGMSTG